MRPNVTVLGAGSWGTTLASLCARHGPTTIWALEDEVVTSRLLLELARRHGVEMPIAREIDRVVHGEVTALEAYRGLVRRPPGPETH